MTWRGRQGLDRVGSQSLTKEERPYPLGNHERVVAGEEAYLYSCFRKSSATCSY